MHFQKGGRLRGAEEQRPEGPRGAREGEARVAEHEPRERRRRLRAASRAGTGLNCSFGTKNIVTGFGNFTECSLANFLHFSMNFDMFAHICEIPRIFHQNMKVK